MIGSVVQEGTNASLGVRSLKYGWFILEERRVGQKVSFDELAGC